MIVDSSAIIAILKDEQDRDMYLDALTARPKSAMSMVNYLETAMIIDRQPDRRLATKLEELLHDAAIELRPPTSDQIRIARTAWKDFGKGSGHRAQLNFGDLFAYALAMDSGEPLLFKGGDFDKTDVKSALEP